MLEVGEKKINPHHIPIAKTETYCRWFSFRKNYEISKKKKTGDIICCHHSVVFGAYFSCLRIIETALMVYLNTNGHVYWLEWVVSTRNILLWIETKMNRWAQHQGYCGWQAGWPIQKMLQMSSSLTRSWAFITESWLWVFFWNVYQYFHEGPRCLSLSPFLSQHP